MIAFINQPVINFVFDSYPAELLISSAALWRPEREPAAPADSPSAGLWTRLEIWRFIIMDLGEGEHLILFTKVTFCSAARRKKFTAFVHSI